MFSGIKHLKKVEFSKSSAEVFYFGATFLNLFSENKPVTWAALASKNTSGGVAPPPSSFPAQGLGHVNKPPPMRSEGPKASGNPVQAPQGQRAPR